MNVFSHSNVIFSKAAVHKYCCQSAFIKQNKQFELHFSLTLVRHNVTGRPWQIKTQTKEYDAQICLFYIFVACSVALTCCTWWWRSQSDSCLISFRNFSNELKPEFMSPAESLRFKRWCSWLQLSMFHGPEPGLKEPQWEFQAQTGRFRCPVAGRRCSLQHNLWHLGKRKVSSWKGEHVADQLSLLALFWVVLVLLVLLVLPGCSQQHDHKQQRSRASLQPVYTTGTTRGRSIWQQNTFINVYWYLLNSSTLLCYHTM